MTENATPSQTALFAAAARAAHPLVDQTPHLLHDEDAASLCRTMDTSPLDYQISYPDSPVLAAARLSACIRSRFTEDLLHENDIDQVIVIGAGLDTIDSRLPANSRRKVWMSDRATVLQWRSDLFSSAGLTDSSRHLPMDLTDGITVDQFREAGIDIQRPVSIIWLGVSMYLHPEQCRAFFASLSDLAPGSRLIFDYHLAPEMRDSAGAEYATAVAKMAGGSGEPWLCSSSPDTIRGWLHATAWSVVDDLNEADIAPVGFFEHQDHLRAMSLVRLVHASLQ